MAVTKPLLSLALITLAYSTASADVTVENRRFRLTVGDDATVKSLVHKPSQEECLDGDAATPFCSIKQYRPYDNENFLMFPAKPRTFAANKIERHNDTLRVEFQDTYDIAYIKVNETDDYISFDFVGRDYRIEDFGVKRKTEIDEFTIAQLPVKPREHFGEWLNVMWDDSVAVALTACAPTTCIDAFTNKDHTLFNASTLDKVKLYNSATALIVCRPDEVLDCIDTLEQDYSMPRGVKSRRNKEYPYSYYELRNVTPENIDRNIALAKQGGFKTMVVYYVDFAKACGHYEWRAEYPGGIDDLKAITDKITAAGMIPGIHIHYSKIAVTDPYINNGIPDTRTNYVRDFVVSQPIGETDGTIFIEGSPEGVRMEKGRRLLHIDDELIMFDSVSAEPPYAFIGCTRGCYNSKTASHCKGSRLRHLDVDDWPLFIRVDQNTSIQKEIAERLGRIYADAGFRFVYFDGAEDVPEPYWYNVSRAQLSVYDELSPAPLYAEGALKSHYGWHILSRGNAFDYFPPERIRPAMKKYTLRCARQIANDFTSVNFGWINYTAPSESSVGMQPDMFDYICSKALAWNAPISLAANLDALEQHPRTADNLAAIRMWEDAKINKVFSADEIELLKNPDKEYTIFRDKAGKYSIQETVQIISDSDNLQYPVRAFAFEKDGKTHIIYWAVADDVSFDIPTSASPRLYDMAYNRLRLKAANGSCRLTAGDRRILVMDAPFDRAVTLFRNSILK